MNKYTLSSLVIIIVLFVFSYVKKLKIIDNKELAVGIITKSSYSNIEYSFKSNGASYTGTRGASFVNPNYKGKKYLVVYNYTEPKNSFMLLNYPLSREMSLDYDISNEYNKDTIYLNVSNM